jgi:hypothetical protein
LREKVSSVNAAHFVLLVLVLALGFVIKLEGG